MLPSLQLKLVSRPIGYTLQAFVIALLLFIQATATVGADTASPITVQSVSITSEFPQGFRIKLSAKSDHDIESIAIRLRIGQQTRGGYNYLDLSERQELVNGELLWRTNTSASFVPPGTIITYNFEILDTEGNRLDTEPAEFTYHDPRFEWSEISSGPVTLAYHEDAGARAEAILHSIVETLDRVAPLLGADKEEPIRVTVYNTWNEMRGAIQQSSRTISQHLITEGQAFTNVGTILVLGTRSATGTASHEVTHIIVHRAAEGIVRKVPPWLHEGLAEFGNVDPGSSYDGALRNAIRGDRVLPVTHMGSLPGRSNDVLLFYGQSKAIVRMMIDDFGTDAMRDFMARYKNGATMDDALLRTYGFDRAGLENRWRESVGVTLYVPPFSSSERPTPMPVPTRFPYTLQPHPAGEFVGNSEDSEAASQTVDVDPTATSIPTPTEVPSTPVPLVFIAPPTSKIPLNQTQDESSEALADPASGTSNNAGCGATLSDGIVDLAVTIPLMGLAAFGFRRRWIRSVRYTQAASQYTPTMRERHEKNP